MPEAQPASGEVTGDSAGALGGVPDTLDSVPEDLESSAGEANDAAETALYKWTDRNGVVQFGEEPPAEYADSAVKVMDL